MASFREILLLTALLYSLTAAQENYRLPTIYSPSNYQITLDIGEEAFSNNSYQYNASVTISLEVTSATTEIQLHASYVYISISSITLNSVAFTNFTVSNVTDIATIYLNSELAANTTYTLKISYVGTLATDNMYGLYRSSYTTSDNETKYLLATQFESTNARRAFPCFDEPGYKATFDLTITHPSVYTALSNKDANTTTTENSTTTTVFNTSPKMPTYLLAYVISDFTCTDGTLNDNSLRQSVCSRNSTVASREWALEVTPAIIDSLNTYTGFNYSVSEPKLDQVAIPDFAAGAMENWGLVTYRETALLYDTNESSVTYKQYVATVVAHELAHQWFGNLVTTKWWSTIFLNEGFATFFEFYVPHEVLPDYEIAHQFVTKVVQPILLTDSYITSQALESNASTPTEISNKFGSVSYSKGGSVLKMIEHFLSPEIFKSGIQYYLTTHQYDNTEPSDLWAALNTTVDSTLSSLPADLDVVVENWITKSGYPVIHVTFNNDSTITFTQERFLLSGNDTETKWYVPLTYTTSDNTSEVENTLPRLWLAPDDANVTISYNSSVSSWILVNNKQTGFYRVNYDTTLWSNLTTALLQTNFSNIPDINRAQVVDDAFNLARASYLTYSNVFNVIEFLANDTSYHSWYAAIRGFDYLIRRVGLNTTLGSAIGNHLLNLSSTVRTAHPLSLTNTTNHVYTLNQYLTHLWGCKLGDQECITTIQGLFVEYQNTSVRPNKDLRLVIYCNALRYSSNISSDWEFLWNAYLETELATEKAVLISALGCTSNETILNDYLLKAITDNSGIRLQDASSVFSSVYTTNVDVAFNFWVSNYATIVQRFASLSSVGSLLKSIAEYFTTTTQLASLQAFINSSSIDEELLTSANEAVEIVQDNLEWISLFRDDLLEYYGLSDSDNSTTSATTQAPTAAPTTQSTSTTTQDTGGAAVQTSSVVLTSVLFFVITFSLRSF